MEVRLSGSKNKKASAAEARASKEELLVGCER